MPSIRKIKKKLKRVIAILQWEMAYYKPKNFTIHGEHLYDIVQQTIDSKKRQLQTLKRSRRRK